MKRWILLILVIVATESVAQRLIDADGNTIDEIKFERKVWSDELQHEELFLKRFSRTIINRYPTSKLGGEKRFQWDFDGRIEDFTADDLRKMRTDGAIYYGKKLEDLKLMLSGIVTCKITIPIGNGDGFYMAVIDRKKMIRMKVFRLSGGTIYEYKEFQFRIQTGTKRI
ncbi:MAG: hypothetical protein AAGI23_08265 [Bacteroidota bacterium]